MDIAERVRKSEILCGYEHIVLGLSGGPDSVCLLEVLLQLQNYDGLSFQLWPVHINHMLRPGDADRDQAYVEELCASCGLPLKVVKVDCNAVARERGLTSEEAGRLIRYKAFRERAREIQGAPQAMAEAEDHIGPGTIPPGRIAIALAHHADDQAETILYRIIRGTGTDGLIGMEPVRHDESGFDILRPLLGIRRAEIEDYCAERGLSPCIDQTNSQPFYARNRIRLELLPLLEQYNPRVVEAVNRLGVIAAEDKAFLDSQATAAAARHRLCAAPASRPRAGGNTPLRPPAHPTAPASQPTGAPGRSQVPATPGRITFRIALLEEHPAVSRRVLSSALTELGLTEDITYTHFRAMLSLADSRRASASLDLPHGYTVRKEYDRLVLAAPRKSNPSIAAPCDIETQLGDAIERGRDFRILVVPAEEYQALCSGLENGQFAVYDREALTKKFGDNPEDRIRWRSRQKGDVLAIAQGRKKLQDVFVDDKIPKYRRDDVQVAAIGGEVLWIAAQEGLVKRARYAAGFGVNEETKDVVVLFSEYDSCTV